jgi:hypothetical protein
MTVKLFILLNIVIDCFIDIKIGKKIKIHLRDNDSIGRGNSGGNHEINLFFKIKN